MIIMLISMIKIKMKNINKLIIFLIEVPAIIRIIIIIKIKKIGKLDGLFLLDAISGFAIKNTVHH